MNQLELAIAASKWLLLIGLFNPSDIFFQGLEQFVFIDVQLCVTPVYGVSCSLSLYMVFVYKASWVYVGETTAVNGFQSLL